MKLAICITRSGDDAAVALRMAEAQRLGEAQRCGGHALAQGALAYVTASDALSSVAMLRASQNGSVLAVSGVPTHPRAKLDRTLDDVMKGDYRSAGRLLSSLNGAFVAAFWDAVNLKLVLVTDFLGLQPAYLVHRDGVFLLASETKGIAASGLVDVEMDPAAWGSFISLTCVSGWRTQLAGVSHAPPAAVLVYDPASGTLESSTYWEWPDAPSDMTMSEVDTAQLVEMLLRDVRAYREHRPDATVLMSGGVDSRFNLCLIAREGIDADILTVAHEGHFLGAEARYAVRAAKALTRGWVATVVPPAGARADRARLRYLWMNDGSTAFLGQFMAMVAAALEAGPPAVWDGLVPGYTLKNITSIIYKNPERYLSKKPISLRSHAWRAAATVFAPSVVSAMHEGVEDLVADARRRYSADTYGLWRFLVDVYVPNRVGPNPAKVYSNFALPFTPGVSRDFWHAAGRIPPELKEDKKLAFEIYRRHFPRALDVPFCGEHGLFSAKRFAPGVMLANVAGKLGYYCDRARGIPVVGRLLPRRRASGRPRGRGKDLVSTVLSHVDPGSPELNADGVRDILRDSGARDETRRLARRQLFYWQAWRMVMTGEIRGSNLDNFLEETE